jgi:hypothetical protein
MEGGEAFFYHELVGNKKNHQYVTWLIETSMSCVNVAAHGSVSHPLRSIVDQQRVKSQHKTRRLEQLTFVKPQSALDKTAAPSRIWPPPVKCAELPYKIRAHKPIAHERKNGQISMPNKMTGQANYSTPLRGQSSRLTKYVRLGTQKKNTTLHCVFRNTLRPFARRLTSRLTTLIDIEVRR